MASKESAMTPEAAAAAIADVKEVRQGLTARAAGIVWMVWGLALAALSITTGASWAGGGGQGFGLTDVLNLVFVLIVLAGSIAATYAVWHSHALVSGHQTRFWLTAGLALAGIVAGVLVINVLLAQLVEVLAPDNVETFYRSSFPMSAAMVALVIAWLQRRRVAWWPAVVVAGVFLVLQITFPYLVGDSESLAVVVRATFLYGSATVVAFGAVGFWHFLRG